ncbi:MAG: hypothetical protein AB7P20_26440 [Rhizobiaceae bacterium]
MLSSSDFRQIARKGVADKAERLFRASISAYCCLSYPTRAEAQQLEDLALPLYNAVSAETLRYVSAALSECALAPSALIARLCEEAPDISAPLLIRTRSLSDIDLIALIARKGAGHARVIARRASLHPTIAALAAAIDRKARVTPTNIMTGETLAQVIKPAEGTTAIRNRSLEATRSALREMMTAPAKPEPTPLDAYHRLRKAALTGSRPVLCAALADVLRIDEPSARSILETSDQRALLTALRALDLPDDRAFLLMACAFPNSFPHPLSIRIFLERYGEMNIQSAREQLRSLRAEALANTFHEHNNLKRTGSQNGS